MEGDLENLRFDVTKAAKRAANDIHNHIAAAARANTRHRYEPISVLQALQRIGKPTSQADHHRCMYMEATNRLESVFTKQTSLMVKHATSWAESRANEARCKKVLGTGKEFKAFYEKLQNNNSGTVTVAHVPFRTLPGDNVGEIFFFFSPYVRKCLDIILNKRRLKKNRLDRDGIIDMILDYNAVDCLRVEKSGVYFGPGKNRTWVIKRGSCKAHVVVMEGRRVTSFDFNPTYTKQCLMERNGFGFVALVGKKKGSLAGTVRPRDREEESAREKKQKIIDLTQ